MLAVHMSVQSSGALPPRVHMLASSQMMACGDSTNGASAMQWEVAECGLPNMPTGLESSPQWRSGLSPPQSNHAAPLTSALTLPTGYNYSAFFCSLFSLSQVPLSLSQLGWVLTLRSRRRAAGPLLCVHNMLNATHCSAALNRWGWWRQGRGGGGLLLTRCQGPWAGGRWWWCERTDCPSTHLPPSFPPWPALALYLLHPFISSVPGQQRSSAPVLCFLVALPAVHRSEVTIREKSKMWAWAQRIECEVEWKKARTNVSC